MTPQEQNIAVAELMGWKWYRIPPHNRDRQYRGLFHPAIHEYPDQSPVWLEKADGTERECTMEYMHRDGHVPKYHQDLNACHAFEMEQKSNGSTIAWKRYREHLEKVCLPSVEYWHATAPQRVEAFLRLHNKWKD